MANEDRLPIKVVLASDSDFRRPPGGGGDPHLFGDPDDSMRQKLVTEVDRVEQAFAISLREYPGVPAVARVSLKREAVAKTHRPTSLFDRETCPIIGSQGLGELHVSVDMERLRALRRRIREASSKTLLANLTTIDQITPYSLAENDAAINARLARHRYLKCRLFDHRNSTFNATLVQTFLRIAEESGADASNVVEYADGLQIHSLRDATPETLNRLSGFIGLQSLSPFPLYQTVRTSSLPIGILKTTDFPPPLAGVSYGVVGVVDTGSDPGNALLQAWVIGRDEYVPPVDQDNAHGTFVAALVPHAKHLNHGNPLFPQAQAKVLDVVAIGRDGIIAEDQLISILRSALTRYPDVKVWNLSLALMAPPCRDDAFSDLACALDRLADAHGVLFVLAAGNYVGGNTRNWPSDAELIGEDDRICPPADSLRALTVGSLAHARTDASVVNVGEPSSFSRRGPSAAYLIKPELSVPGGNCSPTGDYAQTGIVSLNTSGQRAEDIGTSFAVVPVSALAAEIHHELRIDNAHPAPTLLKALALHGAFVKNGPVEADRVHYVGLGGPPDASEVLTCAQSSATLIFEVQMADVPLFEKRHFPMPPCLNEPGTGLVAEVFMTLAYAPPVDARHGFEYCRVNIDASLGVLKQKLNGKFDYDRQVEPTPKALDSGFEEELVKHGFKWSPVKFYYRRFHRGPVDREWRLSLETLCRSGQVLDAPLTAYLIVTIRDPKGIAPVYDEMVRATSQLGWTTQDLELRSRQRQRP